MGKSLKGKELGKGITQNHDGLYVGRFTDRFGKRKSIYDKSLTALRNKLRDAEYEDKHSINVADPNMTMDEWFNVWIDVCKSHCRETTIDNYSSLYRGLSDEIGWRKVSTLNTLMLQKVVNGVKTDTLRKKAKAILNDMLNCAIDADIITKNPAKKLKVNITDNETKDKHILSDSEIETFKAHKDEIHPVAYAIFILGLNTGMRIGEMAALTWDDVDFEKGEIRINKCLRKVYGKNGIPAHFNIHPTKTKAGNRVIPMTVEAKKAFEFAREVCGKYKEKHEPIEGFEDLIFVTRSNHPISNVDIISVFDRAVDKIDGIERFTPHCLRHTFATKCIAKGMKPKTLQMILGHASLKMTMDLYCHVESSTMREDMGLIGALA